MNEKVIYTCISGDYDALEQPLSIQPDVDYVCFTDNPDKETDGVWQLKKIPYKHPNPTLRARFVKLNPHKVLPNYKYSLWMDANIRIAGEDIYRIMDRAISEGTLIGHVSHLSCDCIYQEVLACATAAREKMDNLKNIYRFLRQEGYPEKNGLFETNIVFRRHNNPKVSSIMTQWWEMLVKYTRRDQLTQGYVYWKNDFEAALLMPPGINSRNHPGLVYKIHNKPSFTRSLRSGFMRVRNRTFIKWFGKRYFG